MPLDTFICGQCQENFNDIQLFINHKKECIPITTSTTTMVAEAPSTTSPAVEETAVQIADALEYTAVDGTVNVNVDSADLLSQVAQAAMVTGDDSSNTKAVVIITSPQATNTTAAVQPLLEALESVSVDQLQPKTPIANATNVISTVTTPAVTTAAPTTTAAAVATSITSSTTTTTTTPSTSTGRRRGRPRKGEEKNVQRDAVPKEPEKLPIPDKGKDGKYHCSRCKRAFPKQRYFITHKCLASSDYVDISKKDVVKIEGDESEEEPEEVAAIGDQEEYEAHTSEEDDGAITSLAAAAIAATTRDPNSTADVDGQCSVQMSTNPDLDSPGDKSKNHIQDIPVFNTDEEKVAFERSLNVDLSGVDHMFRTHVIEQDLNENAPSAPRTGTFGLSLYSCNTCDKVFKTLSHMRLHCLIHTNLKPFKCSKCNYASNSKGNLYTHMRKHTGQFYNCSKCPFKTVNKSHLLEHEATHSKVRHPCEMCKKDYNTIKSLVNHVRKYHSTTKKGRDYLAKFLQGRQDRGTTVIHQCHVCNRKFKKKIDCDRHLFVHDIKDIPSVQHCELCDYSASRRIYLEKHFLKHRVIYCCCLCQDKFLSTVRLLEHINSTHVDSTPEKTSESIFEQSVASSLYLPEPDDTLHEQDKEFDNLPPELSAVAINNSKNAEETTEPMETSVVTSSTKTSATVTTVTTSDAEVSDSANMSVDPMEIEMTEQTSTVAKDAEALGDKLPEPIENGETNMDTSENGVSEDVKVKVETAEKDSRSLTATDGNELETAAEIDTAAGNIMTDEENPTSKNNKDPSSPPASNTVSVGEERLKLQNNSSETGETENGEDLPSEDEDPSKSSKASDIIKRLGYRPLTLEIFQKMRETFGSEECEYCGRLFYNRADYEPHVQTHTGDKPFQCEVCDYRTITRDNLKRHVERKHDKVTFPCKECDFVANSRTQLWKHQLKHRGISGLECPQCHEKFENLKKLRTHILLKHPTMSKEEVQRVTGLGHRIQRKMGRRSYKCPYCDRVFIRANSELRKHIWIHEGIKPFRCPVCPHACRSKNNLQAHMLRHSNEKPFMCNDCGKAYKSKTALRWHVRSHKDGKLFKCDKCSYEATQRSHLKRHMETHDIVKRYVCQHCDYSANTLGYMKVHYTRNHKGMQYTCNTATEKGTNTSDSRVYRCLSCDYLFGNLSDLKRHLRIRHHVQVQDIQTLENTTASELVFQVSEDPPVYTEEANTEIDEKTASAVNILQHIIDMSQQGAFGQQQITVQSDSGQMVTVNPETIIVQEEGQEVLVADGNQDLAGNQFVIQYVTAPDGVQIASGETPLEVHTADIQNITTTATELHQEIVQS